MRPKRLECWYVGTMLVVIGWCVEIRDQEKNTGIWFKSVRDEHEGTPKFDGHPQLKHCFFSIFGSKPWHPNRQKPWSAIVLGVMGASRSSSCPSWETCRIQETLLWLLGRETKGGEPVKTYARNQSHANRQVGTLEGLQKWCISFWCILGNRFLMAKFRKTHRKPRKTSGTSPFNINKKLNLHPLDASKPKRLKTPAATKPWQTLFLSNMILHLLVECVISLKPFAKTIRSAWTEDLHVDNSKNLVQCSSSATPRILKNTALGLGINMNKRSGICCLFGEISKTGFSCAKSHHNRFT